jgi:murein L,D-transpeptidase YcbB/YkuD
MRRIAIACAALATLQCSSAPPRAEISAALRAAVEAKEPPFAVEAQPRGHHVWRDTQQFYRDTGYQLAWSDGRRPRSVVADLLRALRAAKADGLDPSVYPIDTLDSLRTAFDPARAADADLKWTYAYLRFAADLAGGTVDPETIDAHWHAAPSDIEPPNALREGLDSGRVAESLQKLAPHAPEYVGLKRQLALAAADERKASTIAMNMERWRWLPGELGSRYVVVNIPSFALHVVEDSAVVLEMKVVTGKKDSRTPVLSDRLTQVVFSPYWNIPADIVEHEILPKAEKDPAYLDRLNIEADGERYRQRPGRGNSLGLVKFVFPNHYNVYLHDTPAHALFNHDERDLSHGCVRLEHPADLAKYLLRDQPQWTEERIAAAMNAGVEHAVALSHPLPIYLTYFTAWEEDGALHTAPDVYGYDRRHLSRRPEAGE